MDKFLQNSNDQSTLIKLNTCRIYSKVYYITDMLTLDGRELLPNSLRGQTRRSKWKWPKITPPRSWWETWESYVRSYILPLLPVESHPPSEHQIYPAKINERKTAVIYEENTYVIGKGVHLPPLLPRQLSEHFILPCDITKCDEKLYAVRPKKRIICIPEKRGK